MLIWGSKFLQQNVALKPINKNNIEQAARTEKVDWKEEWNILPQPVHICCRRRQRFWKKKILHQREGERTLLISMAEFYSLVVCTMANVCLDISFSVQSSSNLFEAAVRKFCWTNHCWNRIILWRKSFIIWTIRFQRRYRRCLHPVKIRFLFDCTRKERKKDFSLESSRWRVEKRCLINFLVLLK